MSTKRQFSLDEWLDSGTIAQRTAELYNDQALPDQLRRLEVRRKALAAAARDIEMSVTDLPESAELDAEYQRLAAAYDASKETWVERALSRDEVRALRRMYVAPAVPEEPKKNSPEGAKVEHKRRMEAWADEALAVREASDLHYLEWATVRVETSQGIVEAVGETLNPDGTPNEDFQPAVTRATLQRLVRTPGRQGDIGRLLEAASAATANDVEAPAPFSPLSSKGAPS